MAEPASADPGQGRSRQKRSRPPTHEGGLAPAPTVLLEALFEPGGLGERVEVLPDRVLLYVADGDAAVAEVTARGLVPAGVLVRRSSLEDVFLHLTGRTLID